MSDLPEALPDPFENLLVDLRELYHSATPEHQAEMLVNLQRLSTPAPAVSTISLETDDTRTLEQKLAGMYDDSNYDRLGGGNAERSGAIGVLVTNENTLPGRVRIPESTDGYIIGTGNGAIWAMLDMFPKGNEPKGIISLDRDPSVILSGMVLVELAKRGISKEEAVAYLFDEFYLDRSLRHTLEDIKEIAEGIVASDLPPKFNDVLFQAFLGPFKRDMSFSREKHYGDYKRPKYDHEKGPYGEFDKINIAAIIYDNWDKIKKLAQEGKIFFAHSDIANPATIDFIAKQIPEIRTARNLIYTSNIVDYRYRSEVDALQGFNTQDQSTYVFTTQKPDNYTLRSSSVPPRIS
jgi:hypothetical protein